jgi:hypothetical protein
MSDREKIGVSYGRAHTLYLDLNFDILHGCQWSCVGCFVNKVGQGGFLMSDYIRLMDLINSAQANQYRPFIATVGPTDVFSATNAVSILSDVYTRDILSRFEKISFASTFLAYNEQTEKVIDVLNEHYADKPVEVNITFEMRQMHNEGYLNHVKEIRNRVFSRLHNGRVGSHALFNVFDYSRTRISELLANYAYLHEMIEQVFGTDIDFNFSIGRKEDLTTEEFIQAAEQIKRLFNDNVRPDTVEYIRFSVGRLTDSLVERQYNFRNGKLYYSPMFYERYVSFAPHYEIPLDKWTIDEIEKFEDNLTMTQYQGAPKKECGSCIYLGSCVDRGILHLMDEHKLESCVLAKDAMNVANHEQT